MDMLQIFGDYLHLLGVIILLMKLLLTSNCAGISGKTQLLHGLVFTTRYLDLTTIHISPYDTTLKIVFVCITYITIISMFLLFRQTYERQRDSFRIELLILPCAVLALFVNRNFETFEVLRTFSTYLEAVAIIPQVYLVSKSKQIESIVVSYVACLGLYRGCYVMHWFYDYSKIEKLEKINVACGIVQLIFYIDFFARNLPILKVKGGSPRISLASVADKRTRIRTEEVVDGQTNEEVGKDIDVVLVVKPEAVSLPEKITLLTAKEPGMSN